jgi:hypothetical protein
MLSPVLSPVLCPVLSPVLCPVLCPVLSPALHVQDMLSAGLDRLQSMTAGVTGLLEQLGQVGDTLQDALGASRRWAGVQVSRCNRWGPSCWLPVCLSSFWSNTWAGPHTPGHP